MSSLLILGGSGIISSEITSLAISKGFDVTIINRGKRKNFLNSNAKLIIADLRNDSVDDISQKLGECRYEAIIDVISYNLEELKRNMELAKNRCNQYFFFSSSVVYSTKNSRYQESDDANNREWSYAVNKKKCEEFIAKNHQNYGFNYTIIRPYITYGKSRIPLQLGPIQYSTIINRAKHGKLVPIYENNARCTLTYSKDFAVGITGLIGNSMAYNTEFHITGNYETTWHEILDEVMISFGINYSKYKFTEKILRNRSLTKGIDSPEVYGDKGRDMLFDNTKICKAVPEFTGETPFETVLPEIVEYFSDTKNQIINYAWDGRIDNILSKMPDISSADKKKLKFSPGASWTKHDRLEYIINRYDFYYFIYSVMLKLKRMAAQ